MYDIYRNVSEATKNAMISGDISINTNKHNFYNSVAPINHICSKLLQTEHKATKLQPPPYLWTFMQCHTFDSNRNTIKEPKN